MSAEPRDPPYAEKEIRCPKLGGQVTFEYCRVENQDLPCARAITCWSVVFDAEDFFRETLTEDEFAQAFCSPVRTKLDTLMEMIERAKKVAEARKNQTEPS